MADAPFIVGQDRQKKAIADALRMQAQVLSEQQDAPIVSRTAASGAFPGMTQANTAGIIQNSLNNYLKMKAGLGSVQAAQDAENERQNQLGSLLQDGQPLDNNKLIKLQQLGVDPRLLANMQPKQQSEAPMLQAITQNPRLGYLFEADGRLPKGYTDRLLQGAKEDAAAARAQEDADMQRKLGMQKQLIQYQHSFDTPDMTPEQQIEFERKKAEAKKLGEQAAAAPTSDYKSQESYDILDKIEKKAESGDYPNAVKLKAMDAPILLTSKDAKPESMPSSLYDDVRELNGQVGQLKINALQQFKGYGRVLQSEFATLDQTKISPYDSDEIKLAKIAQARHTLDLMRQKVDAAKASGVAPDSASDSPQTSGWKLHP